MKDPFNSRLRLVTSGGLLALWVNPKEISSSPLLESWQRLNEDPREDLSNVTRRQKYVTIVKKWTREHLPVGGPGQFEA